MAGRVDGRKLEDWAQRLRRYGASGLTVAEFCRREGVSVPSFYQWRSRLGIRGAGGRGDGRRRRLAARSQAAAAGLAFQRIEVSPTESAVGMTVELPGQVQLRVAGDVRVIEAVMRQLIAATGIERGGA